MLRVVEGDVNSLSFSQIVNGNSSSLNRSHTHRRGSIFKLAFEFKRIVFVNSILIVSFPIGRITFGGISMVFHSRKLFQRQVKKLENGLPSKSWCKDSDVLFVC